MKWSFTLLALLLVAMAAVSVFFPSAPQWIVWMLLGMMALAMIWLYRTVISPMNALATGVELVRGQDFTSRLVKVGYPGADRLVDLFNRMLERIKEERLSKEETNMFLEQLIEASPTGIVILDFEGRVVRGNPVARELLGEETEIRGKLPSENEGELWRAVSSVPLGGSATVRLSDNRIFRVAHLWFMDRGFRRPFLVIETLTDEMHRAEKDAYGKVIRMLAHEVNNSMAGVKSLLETLSEIMTDDDGMKELVESCRDRCQAMSAFITSYADVVRIPSPTMRPVELNSFLQRQLPFLEGLAASAGNIAIELDLSDSPVEISGDEVLLGQVMVNVVKNALESVSVFRRNTYDRSAGDYRGKVVISTYAVHPRTLVVTDNGVGVSGEVAGKLFTPFFSTKPDGQGIGLMCVGEILRRHGARYSLVTSPADRLTRFTVRFP